MGLCFSALKPGRSPFTRGACCLISKTELVTLCLPPLSVEFFQARTLEWVAISFSRGSSWPTIESASPVSQENRRQILCHWESPAWIEQTHNVLATNDDANWVPTSGGRDDTYDPPQTQPLTSALQWAPPPPFSSACMLSCFCHV